MIARWTADPLLRLDGLILGLAVAGVALVATWWAVIA